MIAQSSLPISAVDADFPPTVPILSRQQYRSCHVWVADIPDRQPAILLGMKYYSLFKVVKSKPEALELINKLSRKQQEVAVTLIPKGFGIWVYEPDAISDDLIRTQPDLELSTAAIPNTSSKVLESRDQYQSCYIRVPDLDKPLVAIAVNNKYYALFKAVPDQSQALILLEKLEQRGDDTVITRTTTGYAVWVREVDAQPERVF